MKRIKQIIREFSENDGEYGCYYILDEDYNNLDKAILTYIKEALVPKEDKRTPVELNLEIDGINFNDKGEANCYQWGYNNCRNEILRRLEQWVGL